MSPGLFPEIGRVPLPDVAGSEQAAPEVFEKVESDMVAAMLNARLDGQDQAIGVLVGHQNRVAEVLDGVQSDDIQVEKDPSSGASRWELPEKHYEESTFEPDLQSFSLRLEDGADITIFPGFIEHHGVDGVTFRTVATSSVTLADGYNLVYVALDLSTGITSVGYVNGATETACLVAFPTTDADKTMRTPIYLIRYVSATGVLSLTRDHRFNVKIISALAP